MGAHVINPHQLKMFMTSDEIKGYAMPNIGDVETHTYTPGFDEDPEGTMWEAKSDEAHETGLTSSVRRGGVREPVQIEHRFAPTGTHDVSDAILREGHHRVQAAEDASRLKRHDLLIPVEHSY
jgi:hypothetical protein